MNFMGYNCRPGRSVKVNLPSLNIVGEFIVTDWSMSPDSGCNVSVSQNEPAIFDDAVVRLDPNARRHIIAHGFHSC